MHTGIVLAFYDLELFFIRNRKKHEVHHYRIFSDDEGMVNLVNIVVIVANSKVAKSIIVKSKKKKKKKD